MTINDINYKLKSCDIESLSDYELEFLKNYLFKQIKDYKKARYTDVFRECKEIIDFRQKNKLSLKELSTQIF